MFLGNPDEEEKKFFCWKKKRKTRKKNKSAKKPRAEEETPVEPTTQVGSPNVKAEKEIREYEMSDLRGCFNQMIRKGNLSNPPRFQTRIVLLYRYQLNQIKTNSISDSIQKTWNEEKWKRLRMPWGKESLNNAILPFAPYCPSLFRPRPHRYTLLALGIFISPIPSLPLGSHRILYCIFFHFTFLILSLVYLYFHHLTFTRYTPYPMRSTPRETNHHY